MKNILGINPPYTTKVFITLLSIFVVIFFVLTTVVILSYINQSQRVNSYAATLATIGPSGEAMPVGDISGWHQIFSDDFTTDVPVGGFSNCASTCSGLPADVKAKWTAYPDGWQDTSKNGTYYPSKVISIANGMMNLYLHTETVNGTTIHMVSAPEPILPGAVGKEGGLLYGRYAIRFRADQVPGYKTAWLLWPDSEVWPRDGEIDFPEGDLTGNIDAFMHWQGGTSGSSQDAYSTNANYSSWHTAVIEWTPTSVTFSLDGQVIGSSTNVAHIPNTPMHWVIQTETALNGAAPSDTAAGNVQIDWVSVYTPCSSCTTTPLPTVSIAPLPTVISPTPTQSPIDTGANLITNPGCEINTNGWNGYQAALSVTTTVFHSGHSSCNVKQTTGTLYTMDDNPNTISNLRLGQQYTARAWVRSDSAIGKPVWLAITMGGGANPNKTIYSPITVNLSTTWQQLTNTVSVDYADRTSLGVYVVEENASGSDSFQADDLSLQLAGTNSTPTPTITMLPTPTPTVKSTNTPTPQPSATPTLTPSPRPTVTPTLVPTIGSSSGLVGTYFANQTLSGTPVLARIDPTINFNWVAGSPSPAVPADHFSVRWQGMLIVPTSQRYTFYTLADDGVRLWVNNQELVNNWHDHSATTNSGHITLNAGQKYSIRMEYYEDSGDAEAKLYWSASTISKEIIPSSNLASQ